MTTPRELTTPRAAAMYVGALLGPSVLLLPGLAATLAGPASLLVWVGLLGLSALLARVFTALGARLPSRGGVAAYAAAAFGRPAGRLVAACFLAGVVLGAPVVCLIGGAYVSRLLGGGQEQTVGVASVLLVVVVATTLGGARATTGLQLGLVVVLVVLIAVAVAGSLPHASAQHWTPFVPHGWTGLGRAAAVLMFSFVGWEAIAPMTARLADPAGQLPRIVGIAFAVTATVLLGLAVATIAVLGGAGTPAPLADLLEVAFGPIGRVVAAIVAVALTLGAVNAYLSGAAELAAQLRGDRAGSGHPVHLAVAATGVVVLAAAGAGLVDIAQLVAIPTALFLTVYLGSTAAAARLFRGADRVAAGVAGVAVAIILGCGGAAAAAPGLVAVVVAADGFRRQRACRIRNRLLMPC